MFLEFEVCNTTRSTITEVPFSRYSGRPNRMYVHSHLYTTHDAVYDSPRDLKFS